MVNRLALFLLIQSCSCIQLPVIIIDYTGSICRQTSGNPFKVMPISTFAYIVHDAMYRSENVLVFVEDQFSVEDITSRDAHGTPYRNLHEMFIEQNAKYISRVADPYVTLQQILPSNSSTVTMVRDRREIKIDMNIKYQFIHFMEPEDYLLETRVQKLRRHDEFIKQTYLNLMSRRTGLIVVFYTGKSKPKPTVRTYPYHHTRRAPSDSNMMVTDHALIRLTGVKLQQGSMRRQLVQPRASTRRLALRHASTRVQYDEDLELEFEFEYQRDGWLLESIALLEGGEEVGRKTMGIGAPYGYSYFCSEPLYIVNSRDKSYITISKYQVEPQLVGRLRALIMDERNEDEDKNTPGDENNSTTDETRKSNGRRAMTDKEIQKIIAGIIFETLKSVNSTKPEALKKKFEEMVKSIETKLDTKLPPNAIKELKLTFTDAVTCGTNFNCHILAGLFVAFIVIGIGSSGIMMLFDCKSNDRLDDPNQKPLVIVAQL